MRRIALITICLAFAIAATPAVRAQERHGPATARSDAEKKHDAEIDQAYRAVVRGTDGKSKPVKEDPWQSLRPADGNTATRASATGH